MKLNNYQAMLKDINELDIGVSFRYLGFCCFLNTIKEYFDKNESLTSVRLTSVAKFETTNNSLDVIARVTHHIKISTEGTSIPELNYDELLMQLLPWKKMGNGSFLLTKEKFSTGVIEEIAKELDAEIGHVFTIPDFGFET